MNDPKPTTTCPQCNTQFTPNSARHKYCTKACATKASSKRRAKHRAEIARKWREQNRERAHATAKEYRKNNRQKEAARQRRWRRSPHGSIAYKEAVRKWTLANPEAAGERRLRRAKAEAEGNATPELIQAKWEASNGTCCLCGGAIDIDLESPAPMSLTLEHLTPISRGGKHDLDNLGFSHRACNTSKGSKTLEEYRAWREGAV